MLQCCLHIFTARRGRRLRSGSRKVWQLLDILLLQLVSVYVPRTVRLLILIVVIISNKWSLHFANGISVVKLLTLVL